MNFIKYSAVLLFIISLMAVLMYGIFIEFMPVSYDTIARHSIGVVFGAGITKSSEPSPALKFRLDKSIDLYSEQKIKMIFISGQSAEATVMKNYLIKKGIPVRNIIVDERGETTFITVENVKKYIHFFDIDDGAVFISQKYHIPRIIFIVQKLHIENAEFIAAVPNKVNIFEVSMIVSRETFAWLKNMFFDHEI